MEQRFVTATINCIEFSQHLTQGLWFHSNPLLQLPHLDQREVKLISHKLSKTPGSLVEKAKELGPEKRREVTLTLTPTLTPTLNLNLILTAQHQLPPLQLERRGRPER